MQWTDFHGLSKAEWDFINSFANWASAAGSFAAAFVALHLANRIAQPRANVSVGRRLVVAQGDEAPYPEFVQFKIANSGDRNFCLNQIGWRAGILRKRYALQGHERSTSSHLPVELTHGQEANWLVPMSLPDRKWATQFAKKFLAQEHRGFLARVQTYLACKSLRAVFTTSLGYEFMVKPDADLLNLLKSECESFTRKKP